MKGYVFSHEAENDLIEIYHYGYVHHGKQQADMYAQSLKERCQCLADNPSMCQERDEFTPSIRIFHHKKHLIIYTIQIDNILIIRIQHERMDASQEYRRG